MLSISTQSTRSRCTRRCAAILFAVALTAIPALAQEAPLAHGPKPFAVTGVGPKNLTFGKVDLKVSGTGFIKGAVGVLGQTDLPTHFQSNKQLTAKASLSPIPGDTYAVTVRNGDGKVSPPFPLVVGVRKPFQPNSNKGSDHAWGSNHLVVGTSVNGGDVYGAFPEFALSGPSDANDRGVWIPGFGIDQYGATLASWYGLGASQLNTVFTNLSQFNGATNLGFMGA